MAKTIPKRKLPKRPVPVKKARIPIPDVKNRVEWVAVGIDTSTYSISGAMIAMQYGKLTPVRTDVIRWGKGTDYFTRMRAAAMAHEFMIDLLGPKVGAKLEEVYIAIEEPVSYGHMQRMQSQSIKQQIQIQGALMGGLLRWGYQNIYEIQANQWRKIIADDLGITIHKTKYNDADFLPLPDGFHVAKGAVGKFRSKQWAQEFHSDWDGHWTDLIQHTKLGVIAKPPESKAAGFQPDDRYDALAMMEWMRREVEKARE
jgi:hypothetical protein